MKNSSTSDKLSSLTCVVPLQILPSAVKRPRFGNRLLADGDNVFESNAWDNVDMTSEYIQRAREIVDKHINGAMSQDASALLEAEASDKWHKFYCQHENKFFMDRHWLFTEFPEVSKVHTSTHLAMFSHCCLLLFSQCSKTRTLTSTRR